MVCFPLVPLPRLIPSSQSDHPNNIVVVIGSSHHQHNFGNVINTDCRTVSWQQVLNIVQPSSAQPIVYKYMYTKKSMKLLFVLRSHPYKFLQHYFFHFSGFYKNYYCLWLDVIKLKIHKKCLQEYQNIKTFLHDTLFVSEACCTNKAAADGRHDYDLCALIHFYNHRFTLLIISN